MPLATIEVVSIPVSDRDRAKAFYLDVLGFRQIFDEEFAPDMRWIQLQPAAGGASIVLTNFTPGLEPGGAKDLYLEVQEMEAVVDELKGKGLTFTADIDDTPFGKFARFNDPDGNGWVLHQAPGA